MPFCVAKFMTWSAPPKEKDPRLGSVASHFMAFSGVIEPNSFLFLMMFCSELSLRMVSEVPMYERPLATIAALSPVA